MPAQSDEPEDMEVTEMDGCFHLCDGVITSEAPAGGDDTELQYTAVFKTFSGEKSVQLSAADAQLAIHAFRAVSLRLKEVRRTERNAAQKRWARMEEAHAQELDQQRDRTQQQRWRNTRCGCGRCRPRLQQNEQESRLRPLPPRHASSEREKSWPMCRMLSGKLCCEHIIRG